MSSVQRKERKKRAKTTKSDIQILPRNEIFFDIYFRNVLFSLLLLLLNCLASVECSRHRISRMIFLCCVSFSSHKMSEIGYWQSVDICQKIHPLEDWRVLCKHLEDTSSHLINLNDFCFCFSQLAALLAAIWRMDIVTSPTNARKCRYQKQLEHAQKICRDLLILIISSCFPFHLLPHQQMQERI